jgi:molecular chaperone DnaK
VTATSGLTEEELKRIVDENIDELLEKKQTGEIDDRRGRVQELMAQVEKLIPEVRTALSKSKFGKDAVQKADGVVARARQAILAQDAAQLANSEEQLDRTLQLFKSLMAGTSVAGREG